MNYIGYVQLIGRRTVNDKFEAPHMEVTLTYLQLAHRYLPRETKVDHREQQYSGSKFHPGTSPVQAQFLPFKQRGGMGTVKPSINIIVV